jgi:ubiquinone/menaquinone biosynthesis C-methylase UbiE
MQNRLICPDCFGKLSSADQTRIFCEQCRREFEIREGIPVLLPNELQEFKKIEKNYYEKHFSELGYSFELVEMDWDKNTFGLLDFMKVIGAYPREVSILELGAGNGQYSLILSKRSFQNITVSDLSLKGLMAAQKYVEMNKPEGPMGENPRFLVFDSEHIPFETNTFDIVFSVATLHHLPHAGIGIAEMVRCVKPGGLVIIAIEPNTWQYYLIRPIARILRIRLINKSKDSYSIGDEITHGFSMRKLKKFFLVHGLKVIKTQRVWYITGLIYYFLEFLKRIFKVNIQFNSKIRQVTLKVDMVIEKIPLIRCFSFHNTIIGEKVNH